VVGKQRTLNDYVLMLAVEQKKHSSRLFNTHAHSSFFTLRYACFLHKTSDNSCTCGSQTMCSTLKHTQAPSPSNMLGAYKYCRHTHHTHVAFEHPSSNSEAHSSSFTLKYVRSLQLLQTHTSCTCGSRTPLKQL